jgi:hypothetical protein
MKRSINCNIGRNIIEGLSNSRGNVVIQAKYYTIALVLFFSYSFGQKRKNQPKQEGDGYIVYKNGCSFPRQTGRLDILRSDSLLRFITDSSEMIYSIKYSKNLIVSFNEKISKKKRSIKCDSLFILLFKKGLITSDLLNKAGSLEKYSVSYKGDTTYEEHNVDRFKYFQIGAIKIDFIKNYKRTYFISLRIYATPRNTFEKGEFNYMYPVYNLLLRSNKKPRFKNYLNEFLKGAEINCFMYLGMEI